MVNKFARPTNLGPGDKPADRQLIWNRDPHKTQLTGVSTTPSKIVSLIQSVSDSGVLLQYWEQQLVKRILRAGIIGSSQWWHDRNLAIDIIRKYR